MKQRSEHCLVCKEARGNDEWDLFQRLEKSIWRVRIRLCSKCGDEFENVPEQYTDQVSFAMIMNCVSDQEVN